jgi:hypothetical protein
MTAGNPVLPQINVQGTVVSLQYNVTHAYGGGTLTFHLSEFDNWPYNSNVSNQTEQFYGGTVDATVAGITTITKSGFLGDAWLCSVSLSGPQYSSDISGTDPNVSITVTINTDQGFGATTPDTSLPTKYIRRRNDQRGHTSAGSYHILR